ncbi:MAG: hypothetical protein AB7P21_27505 [Lautropia sp.]
MATGIRHRFESQHSTQTLADGLAEYFEVNPSLKRDELVCAEARRFFRAHDTVHVLYGCGATMTDEAVVKLSSLFGTTAGLSVLRGYTHHETLDIYARLPLGGTARALLEAPYLIVRTLWRCSRQTRRWPWIEHRQYLDVPLVELRAAFGIRVAHAVAAS